MIIIIIKIITEAFYIQYRLAFSYKQVRGPRAPLRNLHARSFVFFSRCTKCIKQVHEAKE